MKVNRIISSSSAGGRTWVSSKQTPGLSSVRPWRAGLRISWRTGIIKSLSLMMRIARAKFWARKRRMRFPDNLWSINVKLIMLKLSIFHFISTFDHLLNFFLLAIYFWYWFFFLILRIYFISILCYFYLFCFIWVYLVTIEFCVSVFIWV